MPVGKHRGHLVSVVIRRAQTLGLNPLSGIERRPDVIPRYTLLQGLVGILLAEIDDSAPLQSQTGGYLLGSLLARLVTVEP